ncbi:single-stranded DNA-binding protein [Leucobacter luti]|uniref:Single-stranded DNA-binding protein n=1 Tax=Leucobacter luti TaxID=340320 RepID=A0A4Q7TKN0_9MICO|nr:single-stranded DNA-binding protein [Leucobacter luti]RZT61156.1 single-strand DNA-binding protein [Leucobacter luti]
MSITVSVVGTIGTIPRLTRTTGQVSICTFRLAQTARRFDRERGQWVDGETSWYTVNSFRGLADHASLSLARGDRVVVSGKLRVRAWQREDRSGTTAEIEADGLGHDLRWGTTRFIPDPVAQEAGPDADAESGPAASADERAPEPSASAGVPESTAVPAAEAGHAAQFVPGDTAAGQRTEPAIAGTA